MILPEFKYLAPGSAEEAIGLLVQYGEKAKLMAGGTDLINYMKDGILAPEVIIGLKEIKGMDQIVYDEEKGLTIGALTKLIDIERSDVVKENYPALAEAVHLIASTQIRNKGTLTGNVCNASPSADSVSALFVYGASLTVKGPEGERVIPIGDFYQGFKKLALKPGEMVISITLPPVKENEKAAYLAHTVRKAMDLAIVGVAAKITLDENGVCTDAKIALGAVAISCVRTPQAESVLIGRKITPEIAEIAGREAMKDCKPISDVRASAEYRHDMVRVFTRRAVLAAADRF